MSYVPLLLAFAVTLSLLIGGVAPVTAHSVSVADRAESVDGRNAGAGIGGGAYAQTEAASASLPGNVTVTRGDEVTIAVSHSDAANLSIGSDDNGFNVSVGMGGSGTTEVVLDTRRTTAADPNKFIEGGSPTLHSNPLDEPMKPAEYTLRVDIDGVERAVGVLVLKPRGEYAMEGSRAPGAFDPSESVGGGEDGDANVGPLEGAMSPGKTVARGDYAVVRIEESGLETAVNASDLTGSAAADGLKLSFAQTDPGPNTEPREYVATDTAEVTVLPNLAEDEIYVMWNTTGVALENIDARNRYKASFALTAESGFAGEETTLATTTFNLRRQSVSLSPVQNTTHYPWDNDTFVVEGQTNRAPGTELEVRVRSSDPGPFLLIQDATVSNNSSFTAGFDLGDVDRRTNATLWVREHFAETQQRIHLVAPSPTVQFQDQTVDGTTLELTRAELPEGGFIRVVDESDEGIGRSDYLEPGRHTTIAAELGTPLFETQRLRAELVRAAANESYNPGSPAYTAGGTRINDTAVVDFPPEPTETPAATGTSTVTDTATPTATDTPTATPYPVETRTPLSPSGATQSSLPLSPGVAIVAFLAAAALFARRGDSP